MWMDVAMLTTKRFLRWIVPLMIAAAPMSALAAAPPTPARAADVANADWLERVHQDLFGRPIAPAAMHAYMLALDSGTPRQQVVATMLGSTEYRASAVTSAYRELTGRAPDAQTTNAFVVALGTTATIESVMAQIVGSPEYFKRAGGTNDGYVGAIYRDLLHRAPTAAERSYARADVVRRTRAAVAQSLLMTDEAHRALVSSYFARYLHRAVDPQSLAKYTAMLASGARREAVLAAIFASSDYVNARPPANARG